MTAEPLACDRPALPVRPPERRFQAYHVGLAKTGTRSVAGIFANYRSLHELLFLDTVRAVAERERGAMSEADFSAFIRWRDGVTRLDMDSASFNCYYVDVLAREFADARFIFAIRDCFSWLDSLLNMVLYIGPTMSIGLTEYVKRLLGPGFLPDFVDHPTLLHERLPEMVDTGFRYWGTMNQRVLAALPADRSLILRTSELSQSLPRLAAFVGVSEGTLVPTLSHRHRAARKYHILQTLDPGILQQGCEQYCAGLMRKYFPEVTLSGYLRQDWQD